MLADQMREHLRVRGGFKSVALELLFEAVVILDDAIVDDGDAPALVPMRVRILVGRRAVGGPARMSEADQPGQGIARKHRRKTFVDLTDPLPDLELAVAHNRQPRAIVAAVFEAPESIQQHGRGLPFAHITNNSTHNIFIVDMRTKAKSKLRKFKSDPANVEGNLV